MTTVMAGIMVARVGHRRFLLCPPAEGATTFLSAMGLAPGVFPPLSMYANNTSELSVKG